MDRCLDTASVGRITATAGLFIFSMNCGHIAICILIAAGALDDISRLQSDFITREETEVFLFRNFHKVIGFDPELLGERNFTRSVFRTLRIVLNRKCFCLAFRIVIDDKLDRMNDTHDTLRCRIEILTETVLEECEVNHCIYLRNTVSGVEVMDGSRCITTAAKTTERRHTRIVPSVDKTCLDHVAELSLRKYRMGDTQSCKLDLTGLRGYGYILDDPVIQRSVCLKLERAEGVCDTFKCIFDRVREVIHRIDAPLVTGVVVTHVVDTVDRRITHIEVAGSQIDLRTKCHGSIFKLAVLHSLK